LAKQETFPLIGFTRIRIRDPWDSETKPIATHSVTSGPFGGLTLGD